MRRRYTWLASGALMIQSFAWLPGVLICFRGSVLAIRNRRLVASHSGGVRAARLAMGGGHGDLARLLKNECDWDALALLERLSQLHQHDVHAARLKAYLLGNALGSSHREKSGSIKRECESLQKVGVACRCG